MASSPVPTVVSSSSENRGWLITLDQVIEKTESAEYELAQQGDGGIGQRKASGSYYTPIDVAEHFWDLFFRHHHIQDVQSLLNFIATTEFIEPAAGSGMFVFSFLKKAASLGASPDSLASVRFHIIDVNLAALRFFSDRLREIENAVGVKFINVGLSQNDFIEWAQTTSIQNAVFVGNPPFVSNPKGNLWRNLYANFVEAMIRYNSTKGISLILPLSLCFSRDYSDLRGLLRASNMGISASSYDNIPDCLFKSGKQESENTNRANSQRCTILNLGGPDPKKRESSPLISWATADRDRVLSKTPNFFKFADSDDSGQIPRPASSEMEKYLQQKPAYPLKSFLRRIGRTHFLVGGVARNYIGIREADAPANGTIAIKTDSQQNFLIVLQAIASEKFFEFWRTYGDGFHITVDTIERFPVSAIMLEYFRDNTENALRIWENREDFSKTKLNSGKLIKSYDFSSTELYKF